MRIPRSAALTALVVTALALAGCSSYDARTGGPGGHGEHMPMHSDSSSSAEAAPMNDVMFAQMMIPHHEQAVEMADMALERTTISPELRALAEQIKAAQAPEIEQMQGWLEEWGATAEDGQMDHSEHMGGMDSMMGMMSDEDMTALAAAEGAEFEKQWLTMMIQHHEGAITMVDHMISNSENPEVKALGDSIVSSQQAEIDTMKGMLGKG